MKDIARTRRRSQEPTAQLAFAAMRESHALLHDAVVQAGMMVLAAMLEEDRARLCGPRYAHDRDRSASRAGHVDGELAFGGRRMRVRRPRVRGSDGHEVALPTWERFRDIDPLTERAVEQIAVGVSTRNYDRSLEPPPPGFDVRGASKSAVSRRFVAATRVQLEEMMKRDLSTISLCVVMIDGIHIAGDHLVLTALGIDERGNKHVLGLYEGATENATVCTGLLNDLVSRGVSTTRALLFVIDGAKALVKAIRAVFGKRAIVQRCQVHKRRNVEDHLPESMKREVGRTMTTAYRCGDPARAKRMLEGLARQLERKHRGAAASLREGLDETLTVLRFKLPDWLLRTLATTNAIEHINSRLRHATHNVARWTGEMVLRWIAFGLGEASRTFRKLRGYAGMPKLVAALRAHDATLDSSNVDAIKPAA